MKKTIIFVVAAIVIAMSLAFSASAKELVLMSGDTLDNTWAEQALTLEPGKVGNAICDTFDSINAYAAQLCFHQGVTDGNYNTIDISEYMNNPDAVLHMWIYIDDIDEAALDGRQSDIHFGNGMLGGPQIHFEIGQYLKTGWTELNIKLSDGVADSGFDPTKVDAGRYVQYGYTNKVMLDDVKLVIPESGSQGGDDPVTPPTADYISVAVVCAVVAGAALIFAKKKTK
ncbi:MAG: hypothetical protein J5563_01530 [Clostridia bacterium]|nr:hypothetical protein [Clostridia bacterium]